MSAPLNQMATLGQLYCSQHRCQHLFCYVGGLCGLRRLRGLLAGPLPLLPLKPAAQQLMLPSSATGLNVIIWLFEVMQAGSCQRWL